ncbi:hypothetical protein LA6_002605 [Marinibacterium anthonyi]|nr:hypothetical protein LA6_002605 [Marinibacterium anthonyi]
MKKRVDANSYTISRGTTLGRAVEGGVGGLEDTPQPRFLLHGQTGVAGD